MFFYFKNKSEILVRKGQKKRRESRKKGKSDGFAFAFLVLQVPQGEPTGY
jgi:hypothetical protein